LQPKNNLPGRCRHASSRRAISSLRAHLLFAEMFDAHRSVENAARIGGGDEDREAHLGGFAAGFG
jgi:hypothetical protein